MALFRHALTCKAHQRFCRCIAPSVRLQIKPSQRALACLALPAYAFRSIAPSLPLDAYRSQQARSCIALLSYAYRSIAYRFLPWSIQRIMHIKIRIFSISQPFIYRLEWPVAQSVHFLQGASKENTYLGAPNIVEITANVFEKIPIFQQCFHLFGRVIPQSLCWAMGIQREIVHFTKAHPTL